MFWFINGGRLGGDSGVVGDDDPEGMDDAEDAVDVSDGLPAMMSCCCIMCARICRRGRKASMFTL